MVWNLRFPILFQQAYPAEKAVISLTKCENFVLKCTKMHLQGRPGFRPDLLWELERFDKFPSREEREAEAASRL